VLITPPFPILVMARGYHIVMLNTVGSDRTVFVRVADEARVLPRINVLNMYPEMGLYVPDFFFSQ